MPVADQTGRLRGQGAVIRIHTCGRRAVKARKKLKRLLTYDNVTVGAAAVCQLHKRARRGRPPARHSLSRYLPAILLLHALSSFSRGTCRGGVSASILVSGGRRHRRYV